MKTNEVLQAWAGILAGRRPSLSIEITKECPLRCPGCYAFDPAHLGGETELRQLSDFRGSELVQKILAIVDREKPLHVSLVGGDPFVRYRELEALLPEMEKRQIHTQVVTSAFRVIPKEWVRFSRLNVVVSIDGLQPEHDERRKPATYERICRTLMARGSRSIPRSPGTLLRARATWRSFSTSGRCGRRSTKSGSACSRLRGALPGLRF